jgi:hypothetical protein
MGARPSDGSSLVTRPPDESAVLSVFGLDALKASGIAVSAADHVGVAVRDVDEAIGPLGQAVRHQAVATDPLQLRGGESARTTSVSGSATWREP